MIVVIHGGFPPTSSGTHQLLPVVDKIVANVLRSIMRTHSTKATAIALIAAASMCFVFASSVQAQSRQTGSSVKFQKAQEAVEHQIIARQVQLVLLGTEVANATNVTATDRSSLVGIITSEQTALETDAANAAAATTYAELDAVQKAVVGDERVYAVVTAQVGLVIGADNDAVTELGYTGLAVKLPRWWLSSAQRTQPSCSPTSPPG